MIQTGPRIKQFKFYPFYPAWCTHYDMWLTQHVIIMPCGWPSTLLLCHVVDPARYYYAMWLTQYVIIMSCGWPSTSLLCHVVDPARYYYDMWLTQHVIIMTYGWPSTLLLCHVVDPARYHYAMWLTQHVIIITCGWPSTLLLCHVVDPARYYYAMWLTLHVIIMTCGWPCTLLLCVLWIVWTIVSCSVANEKPCSFWLLLSLFHFKNPTSNQLERAVQCIYRLFKATRDSTSNKPAPLREIIVVNTSALHGQPASSQTMYALFIYL